MKHKLCFKIICLILLLAPAGRSWAVWPPETALEEESASRSGSARTSVPLEERLENDERRLQTVLQDLKQDEQELHRRVTTSSAATQVDATKEN